MKKIKRFNELFDTEDMKSAHEIDYLSGNLKGVGKKLDYNFKDEQIGNFLLKLAKYHYPFFTAFLKAEQGEKLDFDFTLNSVFSEGYWTLVVSSKEFTVPFGIKINKANDYDIFIYFDDNLNPDDEEKNPGVEYAGLTYEELIHVINEHYLPYLEGAGFGDLVDYEADNQLTINN